jgi:hypothetical protein
MATIINRWDLVEFKNLNGKCRVGTFRRDNGESFTAVTFGESPNWKIVYFSEKVGVLTPAEIVAQKEYYQGKADFHCMEMQNYILENRSAYPEIDECSYRKIHANLHSAASCGVFLGGARGKRRR